MQENMILEQEQLLMAIDDIDDAQLLAEAAVIGKIADLYLRQAMIQESMTEEEFEGFYAESSLFQEEDTTSADEKGSKWADFKAKSKEKFGNMKEKIKNFDAKEMLKKILTAIKNVFAVIASSFVKFIKHFDPRYWAALVDVKSSELARIAKKEGCKLKVNTDRSVTCMFLMPDFAACAKWCDQVDRYIDGINTSIENIKAGKRSGGFSAKKPVEPHKKDTEDGKWAFPMKWTSISDFVSTTRTGSTKTSITGKETKIDGLLTRFTNLAGAKGKINKTISALNGLPADLFNKKDDSGNDTGKVQRGQGDAKRDLQKVIKEQVAGLNEVLASAQNIQKAVQGAYTEAKRKAEKIRAQIGNPDSKFYDKTKRAKKLAENEAAYDERQKKIDAGEYGDYDTWAGASEGNTAQLNADDMATDKKYERRTEHNARTRRRIDTEA